MQAQFDKYHYRRRKTQLLVCAIFFLAALMTYFSLQRELKLAEPVTREFVASIAYVFIGLAACLWVYLDGGEDERPAGFFWVLLTLLAAPLALPAYLLARRGFEAYKDIVGLALVAFCICILSYGAVAIYTRQWDFAAFLEFIKPPEHQEINL